MMDSRRTILFTWELGDGLGHLIPIRVFASIFLSMGCEVYVAAKELTHAATTFSGLDVKLLQAPTKLGYRHNPRAPTQSFSQLIYNNGFSSAQELLGLVSAWKNIFLLTKPDLVFFDHSPSALVAARGFQFAKSSLGVGFSIPPAGSPFGLFERGGASGSVLNDDALVLRNINEVLDTLGVPAFDRLDQLCHEDVQHCFLSLPEFDHFSGRVSDDYYGPVLTSSGIRPKWPSQHARKVYVYMKHFPAVESFFKLLPKLDASFVVYSANIDQDVLNRCAAANIRYENSPLDLAAVSEEADLVVINANHSTSCQFVLAGNPVMMVPLQIEQFMLATRLKEQDLGWLADPLKPNFLQRAGRLIGEIKSTSSAQERVCKKYRDVDFSGQQKSFCEQTLALI